MSELKDTAKSFLLRWSRRKRAALRRAPGDAAAEHGQETDAETDAQTDAEVNAGAQPPGRPVLPAPGLEDLPPIESITATTDLRAFLRPGVPEDLVRSALRRAWVADPAIRDFVGIAENQWDFTKPDTIPGFGSLELTLELRRIVADLVGSAARPSDRPHPEDVANRPSEQQGATAASANAQASETQASNKSDQEDILSGDAVAVARLSNENSGASERTDGPETNSCQFYRKHGKAEPR
jgi:hypothetical protein